jgi:phage tail sheath protein FI
MAVVTSYPGVYIDEVPSGVRPIESAGTSTAVFIGKTEKGAKGEPALIFRWADYEKQFGGIRNIDAAAVVVATGAAADIADVARTAAKTAATAADAAAAAADITAVVTAAAAEIANAAVTAAAAATAAAKTVDPADADICAATAEAAAANVAAAAAADAAAAIAATANNAAATVNSDAASVAKAVTAAATAAAADAAAEADHMGLAVYTFFLNGGGMAYIVRVDNNAGYEGAFEALEKIRDISIICLPGKTYSADGGKDIIDAAISHAVKMNNRMVIVDLDADVKLTDSAQVTGLSLPSSPFSVAYYPWLTIANPFYKKDEEGNTAASATLRIAPGSFAAGMWAKIDGRRGVWKAPAGVETSLLGVAGLADNVDDKQQGQLNPVGINCIRKIPGAGPVIWGSRTLSTKADPEWRYVPVRRTANMIEESIYNNIQWAVFEPNDHRLWSSLRVNIDAFMNGLWRAGAFQGEKASDAYFVRCNLGDTMTQDDIDAGRVIVDVGFAPLKPAEFVIVRIQQKVAQQ